MMITVFDDGEAMAVKFEYSQKLNMLIMAVPPELREWDGKRHLWLVDYEHYPYVEQSFADAGASFKVLSSV